MTQGTLFKNPPKTILDNTERIFYEDDSGTEKTQDVDLVFLLDKGKFQDIPLSVWNLKEDEDIPVYKVSDVSGTLNSRHKFIRDMAILMCYQNSDLLTHENKHAGDLVKNEELFDLFEREFNNTSEKFPRKLWKDIRRGTGAWEKYAWMTE